ncbi:hypothetical protein ACFWMQ_15985 [Streptomyces sp. NPDC058372]|uniref:hypothetical protein n=1 Tax=Streptomyces sp. NPDC058372 TaxID=3346464 RepID=UPI00365E7BC7
MTVCLIKVRSEDIVQAVVAAVDLEWREALGPETGWPPHLCAAYAAHLTRAAQRAANLTEIPASYLAYLRGSIDV